MNLSEWYVIINRHAKERFAERNLDIPVVEMKRRMIAMLDSGVLLRRIPRVTDYQSFWLCEDHKTGKVLVFVVQESQERTLSGERRIAYLRTVLTWEQHVANEGMRDVTAFG